MNRGDIDRPLENVLISLAIAAVFVACMLGCAPVEEPDVALPKHAISWPLTGGLDTKKGPLGIQPGSFLRLDNVVQERQGEWRRRNGWTQVAADTMPEVAPFFVGKLGDSGFFENGQSGLSVYSPSLTSSRWSTQSVVAPPQNRSRLPIMESDFVLSGSAQAGNIVGVIAGYAATPSLKAVVFDVSAQSVIASATLSFASIGAVGGIRGAATATKILLTFLDLDGSLAGTAGIWTYTIDVATAAISGPTLVKAGTFFSYDAMYYTGSTITIVGASSAGAAVFLEYDPSTATLVTNTTLSGIANVTVVSLLSDPDASGVRAVGLSASTPSTRIVRANSTGTVLSNDQAEAVTSSVVAGVLSNAGANWNAVYLTSSNIRINNKTGGVVGTASSFQGGSWTVTNATVDSQAWREPGIAGWSFLLGLHSTNTSDPLDSWVEMFMPLGASTANGIPVATIESLAAGRTINARMQVQRLSAYHFSTVMPVQVIYEDNAGTIVRHYSLDLFTKTYLTSADDASNRMGRPASYGSTAFVPGGQLSFYDGGTLTPLGTRYPPRILTVTPSTSTGSLTPSSQYEYVAVVEQIDKDGRVWRSPPSVPVLVTMGATNNTNTVVFPSWGIEPGRLYRLVLYRSAADGSSPRRWYSQLFTAGPNITVVDTFSDALVNAGEVLYTEGEAPNIITPPAYLAWLADDRLWTVNPEYPTEISYTKNLRPNRLPEFTAENVIDLDDQYGEVTGGGVLDDKIVVLKRNAVYFLQGNGFTDSGSGDNYTPTLISSDVGAIAGSPIVAGADALYFVSERGIQKLDKQGNITWDGEPVDQYLHQPLVQTPETVYDGCFVPSANEVRFLTTNYVLVHNLTFDYWVRWTLSGFRRCLVVNGAMVMFRNDGTVWREGDQTQLTDAGAAFTGLIRSPWMRPAPGIQGSPPTNTSTTGQRSMRLYEGRVIYTRTAGGSAASLTGRLYANNDDAQMQEFTGASIAGATLAGAASMKPLSAIQKCTAFSAELVLPSGDVTVRVDGFAAVIGLRDGAQAVDPGSRYQ